MRRIMLQFITHRTERYDYLDSVRIALAGGCRWVQLRMKGMTDEEVRPVAIEAQKMCRDTGATFIVDDRVELVGELGIDGVHLGKNDMPIGEARKVLGERAIIGGTANTLEDVVAHYEATANYIGCGPFRFTTTKEKLSPLLGLEGYRRIMKGMKERGIDLPIVAIGGIKAEDVAEIMRTGVTGIALSGAILQAADPIEEMKRIINIIEYEKTGNCRTRV